MKKSKINKKKNNSANLAAKKVKSKPLYIIVLALWVVYLYLTLISPDTSNNQFRISYFTLEIIRLSVAIPYLVIWLGAAYSYIKIKRYSLVIAPSPESAAFRSIGTGILLLLGGLILATLASTTRNILTDYPVARPVFTVIANYAQIFPYLFAFYYFHKSTKELVKQYVYPQITARTTILYIIPLFLLAYVWLDLIFTNQFRLIPGGGSKYATYYLNDSSLILTIVIPSLIYWTIGLMAIAKLKMYQTMVNGFIYKSALSSLVRGLTGVILASIFLQALLSLGSQRLLDLGLGNILALVYIFLITQGTGFFYIAKGANNLTKIETV